MKSGLEGRNNASITGAWDSSPESVSMKSGLEGRNNERPDAAGHFSIRLNEVRPRRPEQSGAPTIMVWVMCDSLNEVRPRRPEQLPMQSSGPPTGCCLNEVRPRRPEQCTLDLDAYDLAIVSMKSGLEGRNNSPPATTSNAGMRGLNEVRPRRPEQWPRPPPHAPRNRRLNEVRPRRPEQSGTGTNTNMGGVVRLNEVRPRRPEQWPSALSVVTPR